MKKYQVIIVIFLSSLILFDFKSSLAHNSTYYNHVNADITVVKESSLIEFITIVNDTNFTDYGFPGNGTQDNPYRIEYYSLDEIEYLNGIVIINTTKHFLIQNCYLMALWSAIYIENISDGTAVIQENTLLKSDVGIAVKNSNGVQIINNICGPYNNLGIFLSNTSNSIVKQNTGFQNEDYAICSVESVSNLYWNNNYSFNINAGMVLYQESNATILNNICNYNSRGGFFEVTNSTIKGNMLDNNHFYGCILTKTGF
ncbi:MAG: right-handed parallel beta-helix repeat-containing protein [Candidatus Heimdallarchaeota archaeon]|nr:right-handed parallel beta-helix repeat-containing protein [Candidatus Heimdallarchaeota archaeon]MCG3256138.1 right-handed parallel beta-helix repeat-containing protein [Candidatus Heimdallarchaeota archaeon]MCK4611209.1 right-handed parallel beta-helix repeat-containing protein [Candidatus Heimdallarchaeota archaeon]